MVRNSLAEYGPRRGTRQAHLGLLIALVVPALVITVTLTL